MTYSGNKRFKGEIYIIICAILWGIISLFSIPLNNAGFSSAEITFVRSLISVFFLGAFILIKDKTLYKVSFKDLPFMALIGVGCFMMACLFYTMSIEENGSSVAAMLMYTSPIWTVIISRFLFKERITLFKVIALVGVLGGCAMLSFGGELRLSVKGLLIGLATGVFLSLYGVCGKVAGKKYSAETVTFYVFLFSSISSFFISSAWRLPIKIIAKPLSLVYFIGLAGLSTAAAYLLYSAGLKTVSAGKASMLSTLEIVVATFIGIAVYGVDVGVLGYVGITLTILSLVFLETSDMKIKVRSKAK